MCRKLNDWIKVVEEVINWPFREESGHFFGLILQSIFLVVWGWTPLNLPLNAAVIPSSAVNDQINYKKHFEQSIMERQPPAPSPLRRLSWQDVDKRTVGRTEKVGPVCLYEAAAAQRRTPAQAHVMVRVEVGKTSASCSVLLVSRLLDGWCAKISI